MTVRDADRLIDRLNKQVTEAILTYESLRGQRDSWAHRMALRQIAELEEILARLITKSCLEFEVAARGAVGAYIKSGDQTYALYLARYYQSERWYYFLRGQSSNFQQSIEEILENIEPYDCPEPRRRYVLFRENGDVQIVGIKKHDPKLMTFDEALEEATAVGARTPLTQ